MPDVLPPFRYHPNPLASGSVEPSDQDCASCGRPRGYLYVGPVFAVDDHHDEICPWCISDGQASAKFDAEFVDAHPLRQAGIHQAVVEEVIYRTPGYLTWQSDEWLSHCGDACAFLGHASVADIGEASDATIEDWCKRNKQDRHGWDIATEGYAPRGQPSFHKFRCLHCGFVLLGWDFH